jgi:predicted TPR repeat methyltransferase
MLAERGHRVDLYDPFYHDDRAVFARAYDFITATEVVEHLRDPGQVFSHLFGMLRPGGWLGIMTKLVQSQAAFRRWHYIRDPTHICFFSRATFDFLAGRHAATRQFVEKDVVLMQKA